MRNVYITGTGIITSAGASLQKVVETVHDRRITISQVPVRLADMDYTRPYHLIEPLSAIKRLDPEKHFYSLLTGTVKSALDNAGLSIKDMGGAGLFLGSTSIDISIYDTLCREQVLNGKNPVESSMITYANSGYGLIASKLADRMNIRGPVFTFTTACTSSINAFFAAAMMIGRGAIDRAVVLGYDLFSNIGFYGFESLKLIARSTYRPFDKNRDGIILGEGCAALVLDTAKSDGNDFRFLGGANLCDAGNVTANETDGTVIARVIEGAAKQAGLDKKNIHCIKAHATGSGSNDLAEGRGIRLAFGEGHPPVTGLKPYTGHTLGASGAVELAIMTECVKRGFVPATPGFSDVDEEINITPITEHYGLERGNLMLNYFGFGGNCTSVIVSNRI